MSTSLNYIRGEYVPGNGRTIMLVGEAPGKKESEEGHPFVGRSGKYLRKMVHEYLSEHKLYLTNTVKVRPEGNRTPNTSEIYSWSHVLDDEIRTVNPILIISLGVTALSALQILGYRGQMYSTCHPSYAQRFPQAEQLFLADLVEIRKKLRILIERDSNATAE